MPTFVTPLAVREVAAEPLVREQLAAYRAEGIRSMLVCPMRLSAGCGGTLVFYCRTPHSYSEIEVQTGQALANLAAAALTTADLYDQQQAQRLAAEARRRQATFLADATSMLSRSLDYQETLAALARLAVPEFADWCAVDMVDETGAVERLAIAHVDPIKAGVRARRPSAVSRQPTVQGGRARSAAHRQTRADGTGSPGFRPGAGPR